MKKILITAALLLSTNAFSRTSYNAGILPLATTLGITNSITTTGEYSTAAVFYTTISTLCLVGQCYHKENIAPELQNEMLTALMSGDTSDLSDDLNILLSEFREDLDIDEDMNDLDMLQSMIQDSFTAQINRLEEDQE